MSSDIVFGAMTHQRFIAFVFLCVAVESSISPFAQTNGGELLPWLAYRATVSLLFLFLYLSLITCFSGWAQTLNFHYVWEPALMLPALLVTALAAEPLAFYITGYELLSADQFFLNVLMMFAVLQTFIIIYVHFIHDSIVMDCIDRRNTRIVENNELNTKREKQWIAVSGYRYSVEHLHYVESVEHYVNLVSRHETKLLRGRISDIAEQVDRQLGMLVHRSYWVPLHAVRSVKRGKTMITLVLQNDTEIPVSRSRRNDVLNWLRESGRVV